MEAATAPTVTELRRVWLVRHGESTWNALGLVQGHTSEPSLTAGGEDQARRCARALATEPVGALYASDLRRALQTAGTVADQLGLAVTCDRRLRERSYGTAEGTPSALLGPDRSGIAGGWVVDADAAPAGGESIRQLYQRAAAFAAEALADDHAYDVVVVCHGGVVRVLAAWLDGVPPESMRWGPLGNGTLTGRTVTSQAPPDRLAGCGAA